MDDRRPSLGAEQPGSPAGDPRRAAAVAELRRALRAARPEDRAVVPGRLEELARRFGAGGATAP